MAKHVIRLAAGFFSLIVPVAVHAGARITEIMYDLPGTDAGREWVEVENTGSDDISFAKWKFFEANTNHGLTLFQGNATTSAGGFAVIADDPSKFLIDNPTYSGTLFGSSFSLSNTGEALELKFENVSVSQVIYSSAAGAGGDGNSLQLLNGAWQAAIPTPGRAAVTAPHATSSPSTAGDSGASSTPLAVPEPSAPSANKGGSAWTFTPQLYVNAFVSVHGVAGAPLVFDAVAVGAKKEPVPNARYVWSFGDGGTVEGKKVEHTYHYPASYVVMVSAASGEWSATDRKEITIVAPELVISEVREGAGGFIEVHNDGGSDVDLSHWMLLSGSGIFSIPQGTVIAAKKSIPFPSAITNLAADAASAALLYPNGSTVVSYHKKSAESERLAHAPEEKPVGITAGPERVPDEAAIRASPTPPQETEHESALEPIPKDIPPPAPVASSSSVSPARSGELLAGIGAAETRSLLPWLGGTAFLTLLAVGGYIVRILSEREQSGADALRREAAEYDFVD